MNVTRSSPKVPSAVQIKSMAAIIKKLAELKKCVMCPDVNQAEVQPILDIELLTDTQQRDTLKALCEQLGHPECKYIHNSRHGYMICRHECRKCDKEAHCQRATIHLSMPGDGCPTHIHRYTKRTMDEVESGEDIANETVEAPKSSKRPALEKEDVATSPTAEGDAKSVLDLLNATFVHGAEFMTALRDQIAKGISTPSQSLSSVDIAAHAKRWEAVDRENAALREKIADLNRVISAQNVKASEAEMRAVAALNSQKEKYSELERVLAIQKKKASEVETALTAQKLHLDDYLIITTMLKKAGYLEKEKVRTSDVVKSLMPRDPNASLDNFATLAIRRSHEGLSANNGKH